ncbi:YceI family protein [Amycolatopsis echigonensis]|uniref:Polyisoprenoid-binding protein n=1 Tax=Amycolatopsis echigonensis TaxID=2576905 RepID=A0A2N3WC81_9PSEU|nr:MULTISPECIES: YceI family protein [Amycolatopsis]MBB2505185.1 polyisoprenoid-binding protein [Amycolatopsis echigonensis]PKV91494.1 polyisoprenoid-binding protein YceI [Amycolatopsis niigatensis]
MTSATTYAHLTGTYTIDGSHSRIGFVARHAMVTKVRGSFNEFEGSFTLDGENPQNSSATVTIQTKSVDTRNADRDGHLRTNDFLSCDEFPTITFTSTGIKQTGEDTFDVTGDLTIKGITKSVTVPFEFGGSAKDPFGNDRVGFEGSTSINRSDFGVTFNAALETGGVLVSDKITLEFEISAIKNA